MDVRDGNAQVLHDSFARSLVDCATHRSQNIPASEPQWRNGVETADLWPSGRLSAMLNSYGIHLSGLFDIQPRP